MYWYVPQCVAGLPDMGEYIVVLEDFPYPQ